VQAQYESTDFYLDQNKIQESENSKTNKCINKSAKLTPADKKADKQRSK